MDTSDMPVTLIIKTPSQSVKDLKIDCGLKWSVHRLKQHLSQVYPGKPSMTEQKLIYSGRLLTGPEILKDILKHTYEEGQITHTVHLLCMTKSVESSTTTQQPSNTPQSSISQSPPSSPAANTNQSTHNTDGLRHRHTHTSQDETHTSHQQNYAQYYGAAFGLQQGAADAGTMPAMLPGMPYSPEQMMWYQQMYTQQMAHYMQYMHHGYGHGAGGAAVTTSAPDLAGAHAAHAHHHLHHHQAPGGVAAPVAGVGAAAGAAAANRGGDQQPMVMNAAGGQAMFDEDEEGNRDWLDLSYIMCRFGVLIMIVYFYSSISRFVMVFGFFVLVWLYQSGYLRIARRVNERPADRQANQPPQQRAQQQENENLPVIDEGDGVDGNNTEAADNGSENNDEESTEENATEVVPPPPGVARVALSFFVTFFTSLIPAHPDAVNAN